MRLRHPAESFPIAGDSQVSEHYSPVAAAAAGGGVSPVRLANHRAVRAGSLLAQGLKGRPAPGSGAPGAGLHSARHPCAGPSRPCAGRGPRGRFVSSSPPTARAGPRQRRGWRQHLRRQAGPVGVIDARRDSPLAEFELAEGAEEAPARPQTVSGPIPSPGRNDYSGASLTRRALCLEPPPVSLPLLDGTERSRLPGYGERAQSRSLCGAGCRARLLSPRRSAASGTLSIAAVRWSRRRAETSSVCHEYLCWS